MSSLPVWLLLSVVVRLSITEKSTVNAVECNCHENNDCVSTADGYLCKCSSGYVGDERACRDINECYNNLAGCHPYADCINTKRSFVCVCKTGTVGDGFVCSDIDECASRPCSRRAQCINSVGSFECRCSSGFTGDGFKCVDIDECQKRNGGCGQRFMVKCVNSPGSYACQCQPGYINIAAVNASHNIACVDVDECVTGSHACLQDADCINTLGSFYCRCKSGFVGDGTTSCRDVDECSLHRHRCVPPASCVNLVGGYECSCPVGYVRDGPHTCNDIDECGTDIEYCHRNAFCQNVRGSHLCRCRAGFTGDGINYCIPDNRCTNHKCGNAGLCVSDPFINSHRCSCLPGWSGKYCDIGPVKCDGDWQMHKCYRIFAKQFDWKTFSLVATEWEYNYTCAQKWSQLRDCLYEMNCALGLTFQGALLARRFLCTKTQPFGDYLSHRNCMNAVLKHVDCICVYPHVFPLASVFALNSDVLSDTTQLVDTLAGQLYYAFSQHLSVIRSVACRKRRIATACSDQAAMFHAKLATLAADTIPRSMDFAIHPDDYTVTALDNCSRFDDAFAVDVCRSTQDCTQVLDMMADAMLYGVFSFDDDDFIKLCWLHPDAFHEDCMLSSIEVYGSVLERSIYRGFEVAHGLLCTTQRNAYTEHRVCLRKASNSPSIVECTNNLTRSFGHIRSLVRDNEPANVTALTCHGSLVYLNCMEKALTELCSGEAAKWQRSMTQRMMEETAFDKRCFIRGLSPHELDTLPVNDTNHGHPDAEASRTMGSVRTVDACAPLSVLPFAVALCCVLLLTESVVRLHDSSLSPCTL